MVHHVNKTDKSNFSQTWKKQKNKTKRNILFVCLFCKYQNVQQGVLCSRTNSPSWKKEKRKRIQASWGGQRSFAVCCCPWYWNQPAAHPVTTSIHAAFTLFQLLWCNTVYSEDRALHVTTCNRWLSAQPSCQVRHDANKKGPYSVICHLFFLLFFLICCY